MKTKKFTRWRSFKLFCSIFAANMSGGDTVNELKKDKSMLANFVLLFGGATIIGIVNLASGSTLTGTAIDIVVWFIICFLVASAYEYAKKHNKKENKT